MHTVHQWGPIRLTGRPVCGAVAWVGVGLSLPLMAVAPAAVAATVAAPFEVRVVLTPRAPTGCTASSTGSAGVSVVCGPDSTAFALPSLSNLVASGPVLQGSAGGLSSAGVAVEARLQASAPAGTGRDALGAAGAPGAVPPTATNTPLVADGLPAGARTALVNTTVPPAQIGLERDSRDSRGPQGDHEVAEPAGLAPDRSSGAPTVSPAAVELILTF